METKLNNIYGEFSDEILAQKAQVGDEDAEEFLIRKYKTEIKNMAGSYSIAGAEAEDAVQEAMIGLFKAVRSYEKSGGASFRTYARVCMSRQLVSAVKAARRKKHAPLNDSLSFENVVAHRGGDGGEMRLLDIIEEKAVTDAYTMTVIDDIFEYINANDKNTFSKLETQVWNGFVNGKSYEEIAAELGKNSKAIYNAMERAKKKILKYLNG